MKDLSDEKELLGLESDSSNENSEKECTVEENTQNSENEANLNENATEQSTEHAEKEKNGESDGLEDELEELTRLFKEELKKARAEEALKENEAEPLEEFEVIQQLDDIPEEKAEEEIPEEELCACCGERARDRSISPNYEYCAECRESMKRYPIGIHHFVTAAVVIMCAVIAVMLFSSDLTGYNYVRLAEKNASDGKITSAITYYEKAISYFDENEIQCRLIKLKSAEYIYKTLPSGAKSLSEAATRIDESLSSFEAKLPMYKKYANIRNNSLAMYATLEEFYSVMSLEEYSSFDGTDEKMYASIQAKLEELLDKTVLIDALGDGKETEEVLYDEGMIRFTQYMLAYSCKKDEDSYKYISLMAQAAPDAVCLYGYELALGEIKNGDLNAARAQTEKMLENNADDVNAYIINSCLERLEGDFDGALEVADTGLKTDSSNADLYRQKAIALILKGDYDGALESAESGLNYSQYGALYYVYLVAATEKGDSEAVSGAKEQIDSMAIGYTDRMNDYLNGKISAVQLFSEGTGDVE